MRRPIFTMSREESLDFLRRSKMVHMASTSVEGVPMLKTLHGVVIGDKLAFHSGPVGEKTLGLGREAVVSAEEIVAELPSTFFDAERACPATTFYQSVQLHGVLEPIEDLEEKAVVIQALMERYQPEGGYRPIAVDEMYKKALENLLVMGISLERLVGKSKLGQNLRPEKRTMILERLWERGGVGDVQAIETIMVGNPEIPRPYFLQAPAGVELCCRLREPEDLRVAGELLEDAYWNGVFSQKEIVWALSHSTACVGARDSSTGRLIGVARGLSDHHKHGWIYDVVVAPSWRGKGVGRALLELLLDFPGIRTAKMLHLQTKDAHSFYEGVGFRHLEDLPPRPEPSSRMILLREKTGVFEVEADVAWEELASRLRGA